MLIAIDGPSGSGKSTAARAVAKRLGLAYLDTGAMYRAVTWAQLEAGIAADDAAGIVRVAVNADIKVGTDPENPAFRVNGHDVTAAIREPRISAAVSQAATNLDVRRTLTDQMRDEIEFAHRSIVVEGRDITTVVAPDADVRVLLLANEAERMRRRSAQLGDRLTADQIEDQVIRRDKDDSTVAEFMEAAAGVTVIDSTTMTLDEVVDAICKLAADHE